MRPIWMRTARSSLWLSKVYTVGVSRTMAAAIEQHHDADGIIWPASVPYQVVIVPINTKDEPQMTMAEQIYRELSAVGVGGGAR